VYKNQKWTQAYTQKQLYSARQDVVDVVGYLHHEDVGKVVDISEICATFIFREDLINTLQNLKI
jgi:hypothetical protein